MKRSGMLCKVVFSSHVWKTAVDVRLCMAYAEYLCRM